MRAAALDYEALGDLSRIDTLVPARKEEDGLLLGFFVILLGLVHYNANRTPTSSWIRRNS